MMNDTVVITGTGIICSLGDSVEGIWDALLSGQQGIRPVEGFDTGGLDCKAAAQVRPLNPGDLGISTRDARIMGAHSFMLMKCAREAFLQSGLDTALIPREDIGFFAGMGMVDYDVQDFLPAVLKSLDTAGNLDYSLFYTQGYKEIYPLWPLSMLNNISFCQVAIALDIKGENTVFSPHADSGALAVAEGAGTLLERKAKVVLAGGVSEKVTPLSLARAHLCGILAVEDEGDKAVCRPFDAKRKGTILGEGCGVVTLELASSAQERGLRPLASVEGYGFACEPAGDFAGPTARAYAVAMKSALDKAGIEPSAVDVIIAHGDGTIAGDQNEIQAINQVFAGSIDKTYVFSSKGALGHLLAGAPVVDIILGISMIRNEIIPMTLNSPRKDSSLRFKFINTSPLRADVKRVLINCQSYEGQAASVIIAASDTWGYA